jgi:hypothetical protein
MMECGLAFVSFCCFSSTDKEQFIDMGSIISGLTKDIPGGKAAIPHASATSA